MAITVAEVQVIWRDGSANARWLALGVHSRSRSGVFPQDGFSGEIGRVLSSYRRFVPRG